jgi:hypothetical protein
MRDAADVCAQIAAQKADFHNPRFYAGLQVTAGCGPFQLPALGPFFPRIESRRGLFGLVLEFRDDFSEGGVGQGRAFALASHSLFKLDGSRLPIGWGEKGQVGGPYPAPADFVDQMGFVIAAVDPAGDEAGTPAGRRQAGGRVSHFFLKA